MAAPARVSNASDNAYYEDEDYYYNEDDDEHGNYDYDDQYEYDDPGLYTNPEEEQHDDLHYNEGSTEADTNYSQEASLPDNNRSNQEDQHWLDDMGW